MLEQQSVLVVEDDPFVALDLQQTIEELDGRVVGPTRQLAEATQMLESGLVSAAIVDCHVADENMLLLADLLAERRVPFVIQATEHLLLPTWDKHDGVPLLVKPLQARTVVARLMVEIRKAQRTRRRFSRVMKLNEIRVPR